MDLLLRNTVKQEHSRNTFGKKFIRQMGEAYTIAADKSNNRKQGDIQRRSNQLPSLSTLQPGDRLFIRNLSKREGNSKLRSYWKPVVHSVIKGMGINPVT